MGGPLKRVNPFKRRSDRQLPGQSSDEELGLDLNIRIIDRPPVYVINRELIQIGNIGAGRYAEINYEGLKLYADGKVHVDIQTDGDLFIGEDVSIPASTYLSIFANNQTYNSEAMIAGDMLIGDNSANKSNILWDTNANKLLFRSGTTIGLSIDTDGDLFLGENVSSPGSTYLSIFANNQTYNSEAMIAGDMLIGDNSANKANILWDKSTGQLLFRGGTTPTLYIDTDGALTAGAGDVVVDEDGITLSPGTGTPEKIKVKDGNAIIAELYGTSEAGVSSNLHLYGRGRGDEGVDTPEGKVEIVAITHDGTAHAGDASAAITLTTANGRIELLASDIYIRGNIVAQYGLHVNQLAGNNEFRVDGDTKDYLIFTNADVDNIGIGTNNPHSSSIMDLSSNTKAFSLPRLTTTQRDNLTPQTGFLIYNSTVSKFQGWSGAAWDNLN